MPQNDLTKVDLLNNAILIQKHRQTVREKFHRHEAPVSHNSSHSQRWMIIFIMGIMEIMGMMKPHMFTQSQNWTLCNLIFGGSFTPIFHHEFADQALHHLLLVLYFTLWRWLLGLMDTAFCSSSTKFSETILTSCEWVINIQIFFS